MYNKLFGKILDSSIWLEATPTRICWITLLAAMDEDGFAHFSAIENLAIRARVTVEEAQAAVDCFIAPDPHSGNPANEGRRIERVPGGFMILNASLHRLTLNRVVQREETRLRVAKHREKHKCNKTEVTSLLPTVTSVYASASVSDYILPKGMSKKTWEDFKEHRLHMKARMTPNAEKRLIAKLSQMVEAGENPEDVVSQSIENGWKGLFPSKSQKQTNGRTTGKIQRALDAVRRTRESA